MNKLIPNFLILITVCGFLSAETTSPIVYDATERSFTSSDQIQEILDLQDQLEELYLGLTDFRNDRTLCPLLMNGSFPLLKKLNLDRSSLCSFLTLEGSIPSHFAPHLESLSIQDTFFSHATKNPGLEHFPLLKTLNYSFSRAGIHYTHFLNELSFPCLEELLLNGVYIIKLDFTAFSPQLKFLSLEDSDLVAEPLSTIVSLKNLEHLNLAYANATWEKSFYTYRFDFRELADMTNMKYLNLSGYDMTFENIEQTEYATWSSLEELIMDKVSVKGIKFGTFVPNLKRLSLQESNITGGDVAQIAQLKNLESLNIASTSVSSASIKKLGTLPVLKELCLANTNMITADFSSLQSLESLDLSDSNLSLASFQSLSKLTQLKKLDLRRIKNTNINKELIQQLQETLPQCEIKTEI